VDVERPQIAQRFGLKADAGALVIDVTASAAGRAGVKAGDVIVQLADQEVRVVEDVLGALRRHEPGDRVELIVLRDGERRMLTVTLGERPGS
jgi:S1-C subfamily serine protease